MSDDDWMTETQLSKWLQVSRVKLQQDRARGKGPPYTRVGRAIRYNVGTVKAWLASHSVTRTLTQETSTRKQVIRRAMKRIGKSRERGPRRPQVDGVLGVPRDV